MKKELEQDDNQYADDGSDVSESEHSPPDMTLPSAKPYLPSLLQHQLTSTIGSRYGTEFRSKLEKGTFRLYDNLSPDNVVESILARHVVALNNVSMECMAEFAASKKNSTLLRLGLKASELTRDTLKLYDTYKRRKD